MNPEDIVIKLTKCMEEIGSLKHRMIEVEEQNKSIQNLTISVKELAINMENMIREQQNIINRLVELENKPAKRWEAVLTALIGAAVGAFVTMYL